jgi:hypothetical protein
MADVATAEPTAIRAGDTLSFKKGLSDYPAPGWVLSYALLNSTTRYSFTAAADGSDHLVTVASATTAAWTAGNYRLVGQVTDGVSTFTVSDLTVTVKPASTAAVDARSPLRRELDVLNAWFGGDRSPSISQMTIGQRQLAYWEPEKLLAYYSKVMNMVQQEEARERLESGVPVASAKVLARL